MGTLIQDLRYGIRMLAKNPAFTAVAVVTLALGIGANTAIFTLINALMLRSLPVERPQELYLLGEDYWRGTYSGGPPTGAWNEFSYRAYRQLREQNRFFTDLLALSSPQVGLRVTVRGSHGAALPGQASMVSGNYFQVLGVHAIVGRELMPEDDEEGNPRPVAVMSYGYWVRNFARDLGVVGKALDLGSVAVTVIGVAPADFFGVKLSTDPPDFWVPLALEPQLITRPQWKGAPPSWLKADDVYWLDLMGRLKPGADLRQASAALDLQLRQMLTAQSGTELSAETARRIRESYIQLVPGARGLSGLRERFSERLRTLTLLVILVLVIACANTANLLLGRAARRQREMSVRLAVGAGRWRVVRQLLTESALLAAIGGLAGLLVAVWTTGPLAKLVFGDKATLPFRLSPDARVLGFTLGVSLLTGIVFGLAPAWVSARLDLNTSLKESAGTATIAGSRARRWSPGRLLVSGQIAVSLCLLVVAGLLVRSLINLERQDLGFNPERVVVCYFDLDAAGYKPEQLSSLYQRLLERVRALPGVLAATLSSASVLSGETNVSNISLEGYTPKPKENMDTHHKRVGPDYFVTDGMTMLAGRPIDRDDTEDRPRVAVVNQTFVRRYLPNRNPLGRHFMFGSPFSPPGIEIVGVVKDAKYESLRQETPPMVFVPVLQTTKEGRSARNLEVRFAGDPGAVTAAVRRAISEIDNRLTPSTTKMTELVNRSAHDAKLIAQLSSFFGLLALLLAGIGLYGLMAYSVSRRTGEIGLRMALGAQAGDVFWMILREALLIVALGIAVGVPAALSLARLVLSQLFGLSSSDPLTLASATALLLTVSALAGYLPARRATKVDPMVALRYE